MNIQTVAHTGKSLQKLRSKYPVVWDKLMEGQPDAVRWMLSNYNLYRSDAPEYTVVQESRLISVDPQGNHTYKKEGT